MNELIVQALEKIKEKDFDKAVELFKKAADVNPKDCAIFWGLFDCFIQDDRNERSFSYLPIYKDFFQRFISEGGNVEFILHLKTLLKMLNCINNPTDLDADWLVKNLKFHELDLHMVLSLDRLMLNFSLNRALLLISGFAGRPEYCIAIFERLLPFKEQLCWQELYVVAKSYIEMNEEQKKKNYLNKAAEIIKEVLPKTASLKAIFYKQLLCIYLELEDWNNASNLLLTMALNQQDEELLTLGFASLFVNAKLFLENDFFPRLKQDLNPRLAIFWHLYAGQKMVAIKELAEDDKPFADLIAPTHEIIDYALTNYPCLSMYSLKCSLFCCENKFQPVMDISPQIFAMAFNVLGNIIDIDSGSEIYSICSMYFGCVYWKYQKEQISDRDVFYAAYAKLYLTETQGSEGLEISLPGSPVICLTYSSHQPLIDQIAKMTPIAKQVDDLRKERAAVWRNLEKSLEYRTDSYNRLTYKIIRLFKQYNLGKSYEHTKFPSLFHLAANSLAEKYPELDNIPNCSEAEKQLIRNGLFQPYQLEASSEGTHSLTMEEKARPF